MNKMHVTIELDAEILSKAILELELKDPPAFKLNARGKLVETSAGKIAWRGLYDPTKNLVEIASQHESSSNERMIELVPHLRFTVLHELRHAWQRENWNRKELIAAGQGPYEYRPEEIDANAWADYAMPAYRGLVTVSRRPIGGRTGFQKLGGVR